MMQLIVLQLLTGGLIARLCFHATDNELSCVAMHAIWACSCSLFICARIGLAYWVTKPHQQFDGLFTASPNPSTLPPPSPFFTTLPTLTYQFNFTILLLSTPLSDFTLYSSSPATPHLCPFSPPTTPLIPPPTPPHKVLMVWCAGG